jgi:hypothetical protein
MVAHPVVRMDQFNMDQFNDTPSNPLGERPVCPTCGGVLTHLLTVSSGSFPQMPFFFECRSNSVRGETAHTCRPALLTDCSVRALITGRMEFQQTCALS